MKIRTLLLTAAAAAILTTAGAMAEPYGPHHGPGPGWSDRDDWRGHDAWHWRDDRGGWHRDHDRYWRPGFGRYVGPDRIYFELKRNHYYRWDGAPYWFHGRYVIRTYDRFGRPVIVEVNPYSGAFIGVIRF